MPDGEMRRPPQLWEQRLARTTSLLGVGLSSSGDNTAIVPPTPPPGSGGGTEPAPVLPPPGDFIKPSTPTLVGAVQGIRVQWDGLNSAGDLWPYDTSWIEVHMDTSGTAFTLGSATLKGRLDYPGEFYVGGLTAGTTYHFRLRGADPQGNFTEASDAASGQTGLTTSSDYGTATIGSGAVSFNARQIGGVTSTVGTAQPTSPVVGDIWLDTTGGATTHKRWNGSTWETILFGSGSIANNAITETKIANDAITSPKIAANAVTANEIAANTITGSLIAANTITATNIATGAITAGAIAAGAVTAGKIAADAIDAMTITGATIRTAASGARVAFSSSGIIGYDSGNNERFNLNASTGDATVTGNFRTGTSGARVEIGSAFSALSAVNLFNSSGAAGAIITDLNGGITVGSSGSTKTVLGNATGGGETAGPFRSVGKITGDAGLEIAGSQVDMIGVYNNNTTGIDEVGISTAGRLRRISSSQAIKYDITTLAGSLSPSVDEGRLSDVATVVPADVLDLAVTEFSVIDDGEPTERRVLGFIADDVADKLPIAATYYQDGTPAGVQTTAVVAALLAVVKEQQATITDLRTRIEALEA